MEKRSKELIKKILGNEHLIPFRVWRDVLWLQEDESLGITRDKRFIWRDKIGSHEANWQNFFRKAKQSWKDSQIYHKLQDYLLFLKVDKLTAREILSCRNVEIRTLLLNQFGQDLGNITEPIRVIKVRDSTTKKYYILRVPPTVKTCKQAIAWTFGMEEDEYDPIKET